MREKNVACVWTCVRMRPRTISMDFQIGRDRLWVDLYSIPLVVRAAAIERRKPELAQMAFLPNQINNELATITVHPNYMSLFLTPIRACQHLIV